MNNEGAMKIEWAKQHMPLLKTLEKDFEKRKPFKGFNVALSIHLEAKTANLSLLLKSGGANIYVTGSNPLSTQDDIVEALKEKGMTVFAHYNETEKEYWENRNKTLDIGPNIVIDDGGDLVYLIHNKRKELLKGIIGANEETTTGVIRDKALEKSGKLKFPVIAVNNAKCKHFFDNKYGTGQSTWDGIMRTTNVTIMGKTVVVAGYGWVGKGIALRAKGLGARVIITEIDPISSMEAYMDGFEVMQMKDAAKVGDIFVTATGNTNVIDTRHFELLKDGAILANAGHFDVEVKMEELKKISKEQREVRKNITEYSLPNGRKVYVLGEGRLVNLTCADGHPIEIMDLSFAVQALAAEFLIKNKLENKVYDVPDEIDLRIAKTFIDSYGIQIDKLTKEQTDYLTKAH
ncbi:MAG: adenosylhomocysteinase [Caldisericaceae bacterium]